MRIGSTRGRALQRVQLLVRGFLARRATLPIACSPQRTDFWLPRHLCSNPPRPFAPAVQAQHPGDLRHQRADADGDGHLSGKVRSECKCPCPVSSGWFLKLALPSPQCLADRGRGGDRHFALGGGGQGTEESLESVSFPSGIGNTLGQGLREEQQGTAVDPLVCVDLLHLARFTCRASPSDTDLPPVHGQRAILMRIAKGSLNIIQGYPGGQLLWNPSSDKKCLFLSTP